MTDEDHGPFRPPYEPTPAEIARECAAIRGEWSPDEERQRRVAGFRRVEWTIPGTDRNREVVDRETAEGFTGNW